MIYVVFPHGVPGKKKTCFMFSSLQGNEGKKRNFPFPSPAGNREEKNVIHVFFRGKKKTSPLNGGNFPSLRFASSRMGGTTPALMSGRRRPPSISVTKTFPTQKGKTWKAGGRHE